MLQQRDSTLAEVATILPNGRHLSQEANADTDTSNSPTLTSSSGHQANPLVLASRDSSHSPNELTQPYTNGPTLHMAKKADSPPHHDVYMLAPNGAANSPSYGLDMIWSSWPANLPGLELLRHL